MSSALQTNIQSEINKLQQNSAYVELYKLDASIIGGSVYYFTNQRSATGGVVTFAEQEYQAIPILGQGFDVTSTGTMPKPTITISNVEGMLLGAVVSLGDLVGATLTRMRTFAKFLDDGSSPNTAAYIGPEKWIIEQKIHHDKHYLQWQLTTSIDRLGFRFGRQCLKDESVKHLYCPGIARTRIR